MLAGFCLFHATIPGCFTVAASAANLLLSWHARSIDLDPMATIGLRVSPAV